MDQNYTPNQTQNYCLKKALEFLLPISITCFFLSYFSLFPLIFHQLHFYSSIYPVLAQALDRKCMFLVFNGILAFLKLSTSTLNYGGFFKSFDDEDGAEQVPNLPEIPVAASVEYVDSALPEEKVIHDVHQHEHDVVCQDVENDMGRLEIQEWEEDDDEEVEESAPFVDDMRVSTEDMNKKFDEFIKRIKEEIRSSI